MAFIPALPLPFSSRSHTFSQPSRPAWRACINPGQAQSISRNILREYERYIRETAKASVPPYLDGLLHVLSVIQSETLTPPSQRKNIHPFVIPLTKSSSGGTGLLRWPTPPQNLPMPIVQWSNSAPLYVTLLSPSAQAHITRAIVRADVRGEKSVVADIRQACNLALGYANGDVDGSGLGIEAFLASRVGAFPDVYEGLAQFHAAKGDTRSALVAAERAVGMQEGWGRPHAFHARMLMDMDRELEGRDAARFSLTLPLWTLKGKEELEGMAKFAGYQEMDSLGKIYRRLYEDKREAEIKEGKHPWQVALDRAAFLLDVCVAEGWDSWESAKEDLGELYDVAQMADVATFVRY